MVKILVPQLIDSIADEFGAGTFGSFIGGKVGGEESMVGLAAGVDNGRGIIGDGRVGRRASRDWEGFPPTCSIGRSRLDEANKIVGR